MEAKTTEWRPGPTVCRCCLTEGCYKDISTEYFWMGKREVYSEMLSETFDLNIAYSQSGGPNSNSRLICEPCISRLRDATDFKRQVLECERSFMQYLDPVGSGDIGVSLELDKEVKIERVKDEKTLLDDDDDDFVPPEFGDGDEDEDDLDDQPLTKLASKIPKKESVDVLDLLDNAKITEKRKSSSKSKSSPAKKTKLKKEVASCSKVKPEPRKKKGRSRQTENITDINILDESQVEKDKDTNVSQKRKRPSSARLQAILITKKNASSILECWSGIPFRWKRNRFQCAYCEDKFNECSDLREHVSLCSTQYNVSSIYSKFKEMNLINMDINKAVCRVCAAPFSVDEMRQHVIQHGYEFDSSHPDGVIPFCLTKESWACVLCRETFNNFLKLYEHMNTHYQYHICPICGKGYMTRPRLRKHLELHVTGTFPCDICQKVFTKRTGRENHKAYAHAKGPRYECPQCNMRFKDYYDRMNHLMQVHSEKEVKYTCLHCDLSFKTSGKKAVHVKKVHFSRQSDFSCLYCKALFRTAFDMKRHMITHNKKNCTICAENFTTSRALKKHLASH